MRRDPTGQWLDEAHPLFLESETYPQFAAASDGQSGYRRGQPLFHLPKEFLSMERLPLLPLAEDGAAVDMILAITIYHPRVRANARRDAISDVPVARTTAGLLSPRIQLRK